MHFSSLPYEIKAEVFTLTACIDSEFKPPLSLSTLSRTCHDFHNLLHGTSEAPRHDILANVCRERFDLKAQTRRLGKLTNKQCAAELKRRSAALKRIVVGEAYGEMVVHDLWVAYLMLLEDDGCNFMLLERAHVEKWVENIIRHRAREELDPHDWPLETELLQLAMAILARVNTRESVDKESEKERERFCTLIEPFFVAGHRYPISLLPTTRHSVSRDHPLPPEHAHTFHTMASAPVYPAEELPFAYFGRRIKLSRPPLALSSIVVWYLRTQRIQLGHVSGIPATRDIAEGLGFHYATVADYDEASRFIQLGYGVEVPRAIEENGGSFRWDKEWYRLAYAHLVLEPTLHADKQLRSCWYHTVYEPGMFTGNWVGRALVPSFAWYTRILGMHPASLELIEASAGKKWANDNIFQTILPMQLNMSEHFSSVFHEFVSTGAMDSDGGVQNGWFPKELDISKPHGGMRLTENELVIHDPLETDANYATKRYKTWYPGVEFPEAGPPLKFPLAGAVEAPLMTSPAPADIDREIRAEFGISDDDEDDDNDNDILLPRADIVLTGETDYMHGEAWGHYKTFGRVRRNDGLFVIVRVPVNSNAGAGRWIFRGYIFGSNTIVGRWRETGTSADVAGYEGTFILARAPDSWPDVGTDATSDVSP